MKRQKKRYVYVLYMCVCVYKVFSDFLSKLSGMSERLLSSELTVFGDRLDKYENICVLEFLSKYLHVLYSLCKTIFLNNRTVIKTKQC
jgi:hypothetical protein